MRWRVAVLTAPRKEPTLLSCVASLAAAGWGEPHVYAEPESDLRGIDYCTVHSNRLGVGGNWIFALRDAVERDALAILLTQDDVLLATRCREYIERSWPEPAHVLWLYRNSRSKAISTGWVHEQPKRGCVYGSLAVAMMRETALRIVAEQGERLAKVKVGFDVHLQMRLDENMHMRIYRHNPSLAQHVGRHSILHPGMFLSTSRRASENWVRDCGGLIDALGGGGDDGAGPQVADAAGDP